MVFCWHQDEDDCFFKLRPSWGSISQFFMLHLSGLSTQKNSDLSPKMVDLVVCY